ncbi:hypothetical protein N9904_02210 [Akkermansiaceae bacterium]|nr:hypothetical protein [Akkermansiaceae bacterium]MDB4732289.1 hypothetical protein [bacterium]MDA7538376.1 hypothetical protein [Akkermansiaceae bacterium]MDB4296784.1 hypothetical protein [Akkermansiaceae bacterium]MDB4328089.1 hypothetical protein [Akkermansiaceae bacterium]
MKNLLLPTLALLIYFLASCSEKPDETKKDLDPKALDPKALGMLDEGIGKYRKIVTSLRNSGLNSKELRDLANDADFSLRDLDTYLEAKKISLETIGISDLGELADEWQGLLNQYNASFLEPMAPKYFGKNSAVTVQDNRPVDRATDFNQTVSPSMSLIYFQHLIERYPSLATEFHWRKDGENSSYTEVRVPPEAIKFAAEFEVSLGNDKFLDGMKAIPDSGYKTSKYIDAKRGWWTIFFDGNVVKSLLISDLSTRLDKVNLLVKGAM